jgi:hypothetical protein
MVVCHLSANESGFLKTNNMVGSYRIDTTNLRKKRGIHVELTV